MDKMLPLETSNENQASATIDYKSAVAKIFAEMNVINMRIEQNQAETAELQAETRAMLNQLRVA